VADYGPRIVDGWADTGGSVNATLMAMNIAKAAAAQTTKTPG
jgi:hypothetical protein